MRPIHPSRLMLVGSLCGVWLATAPPAVADDASKVLGALDPALAHEPVEAALTIAALRQLSSGDRARVPHALFQLEALLSIPGLRGQAITDALKTYDGLDTLRKAAGDVKGRPLRELRDALEANVRERTSS